MPAVGVRLTWAGVGLSSLESLILGEHPAARCAAYALTHPSLNVCLWSVTTHRGREQPLCVDDEVALRVVLEHRLQCFR